MQAVLARAARVQLAVFDLDGVFTDGRLYYGADGEAFKAFHVHDGHGIKQLRQQHIEVAVISGRESRAVERRMAELGVGHLFQGVQQKQPVFEALLARLGIRAEHAACVGDDLPDLPLMALAGLAVAVADARPEVRARAHYCTRASGGAGAVREVCDLLLAARRAST